MFKFKKNKLKKNFKLVFGDLKLFELGENFLNVLISLKVLVFDEFVYLIC